MVCGMSRQELDEFLLRAIAEDGPYGDKTVEALSLSGTVSGIFLAKEDFVLCGLQAAFRVFELIDATCAFVPFFEDGKTLKAGDRIGRVAGDLGALLKAERPVLNLLQRLSGIATIARSASSEVEGTSARVLDTRKTTPGLRMLEKYAVRTGGAFNHRMGLSDGILIKDNHIAAVGSLTEAVHRAKSNAGHLWRVEVEVRNLDEFHEAVAAGADLILLDNMSVDDMARAASERPVNVLLEASGGMRPGTLSPVAETGVDFISVGALTHSARAVDISFEIEEH